MNMVHLFKSEKINGFYLGPLYISNVLQFSEYKVAHIALNLTQSISSCILSDFFLKFFIINYLWITNMDNNWFLYIDLVSYKPITLISVNSLLLYLCRIFSILWIKALLLLLSPNHVLFPPCCTTLLRPLSQYLVEMVKENIPF